MEILVIGAGYVGLVASAGFASVGHHVVCVDIDPKKVEAINAGRPFLHESGLTPLVESALERGTLQATSDLSASVARAEIIFICVETPSTGDGRIDLRAIRECAKNLGQALRSHRAYRVVVVKSTVIPGTTEDVVGRIVWEASSQGPHQIGLAVNPEFLREGQAVHDFLHPDRIVVGAIDQRSAASVSESYRAFPAPIVVTNPRTAEMVKYASNALWAAMISFSNEIARICEVTPEVDIEDVMAAVHLDDRLTPLVVEGGRPRLGLVSYLRAGCGFGGSCLPKDVRALIRYAHDVGVEPELLTAVLRVNGSRPQALVALTEHALGTLTARTLAVLGLAFKPGTDDLRESPAIRVIGELLQGGAQVQAYDPAAGPNARFNWKDEPQVKICSSVQEALGGAEAAILVTAWPEFAALNWGGLRALMARPVIVDGRRLLDRTEIERAGFQYLCVGRRADPVTTPQA